MVCVLCVCVRCVCVYVRVCVYGVCVCVCVRVCVRPLAYVLLAGSNSSLLYSWGSEEGQFSLVLRAPAALSFLSLAVTSLGAPRTLLASSGAPGSTLYQFTAVSIQSDFIPRCLFVFGWFLFFALLSDF